MFEPDRQIIKFTKMVLFNNFLAQDSKRHKIRSQKRRNFFTKLLCTRAQTKPDNHNRYHKTTTHVPESDFNDFRSLVLYLHTGCVKITMDNLPGLLHLAHTYKVDDLIRSCSDFARRHMKSSDRLLHLLNSLERHKYSEYVSRLFDKVLRIIDQQAESILNSEHLLDIGRDSAFSILLRPELTASESTKLGAILKWARNSYGKKNADDFRHTVNILLTNVDLSQISPIVLQKEIVPLRVIPDEQLRRYIEGTTTPRDTGSVISRGTSYVKRSKSFKKNLFAETVSLDSGLNISSNLNQLK